MTEILGMSEYRLFEGSRPKMTYWVCYIRRIEREKSYSLNAARRKISKETISVQITSSTCFQRGSESGVYSWRSQKSCWVGIRFLVPVSTLEGTKREHTRSRNLRRVFFQKVWYSSTDMRVPAHGNNSAS